MLWWSGLYSSWPYHSFSSLALRLSLTFMRSRSSFGLVLSFGAFTLSRAILRALIVALLFMSAVILKTR